MKSVPVPSAASDFFFSCLCTSLPKSVVFVNAFMSVLVSLRCNTQPIPDARFGEEVRGMIVAGRVDLKPGAVIA